MARQNVEQVSDRSQKVWDWTKLPVQQAYLTSPHRFTMYSGGFGTGKTSVLCAKTIGLLTLIPNNLGYLGRLDGKSLKQTTMKVLEEMLDKRMILSKNDQNGVLKIRPEYGGSWLYYGDFKDLNDLKNHPFGFFGIDQAEEISEEVWLYLVGRLRRDNPILDDVTGHRQYWVRSEEPCLTIDQRHHAISQEAQTCRICGTSLPAYSDEVDLTTRQVVWEMIIYPRYGFGVCNPEGPEHWIYQKFGGFPGPGTEVSVGIDEYRGYHASTYDALQHRFTPPDYVESLERVYKPGTLMYDRYLLGTWVTAEGLVYPGFSKQSNVVNAYEKRWDGSELLEDHLPCFEYIDHGIRAPTAVGWVVIEHCQCGCEKPNVWIISQYRQAGQSVEYHAKAIKTRRAELNRSVQSTVLDSQCFSKTHSRKITESNEDQLYSIADDYIDNDIFVMRSQKDWDTGWQAITRLLAPDPLHVHPVTGEPGASHLYVFHHCRPVIEEFATYKWKKLKPGQAVHDEPSDGNDDHMDGLNFFLAGRPEIFLDQQEEQDTRTAYQRMLDDEELELFGMGSGDEVGLFSHMSF